jgi:multidrug efflux pump
VTAPLAIIHEGQFPAVTLSFNLRPNASLGEAVDSIDPGPARHRIAGHGGDDFLRQRRRIPVVAGERAVPDPGGHHVVIYIVLGVLYESYIHPITILSSLPSAGVGALLALMICHDGPVAHRADRHHPADRHREEERDHDDRLCAGERNGRRGLPPEKSIYQACLLRFRPIMMTTMAALLGALPLALESGTGSELRRPLGICHCGRVAPFSSFSRSTRHR